MKTLTEKYRGVLNESFSKGQFVRDARMAQPSLINQFTSYNDAVLILKSKGMISEEDKLPEYAEFENISDEAIRRGIDAELEGMGLMSHDSVSEEDQAKAKEKALKNLKKDPLHYLNLLSGESSKVDKHDKPVEFKKGKEVDTFNGTKKAELKEEAGIPTAFDNENMEALLQIVLKYVEDPDEAEAAVQKVDDHGLDSLAPELLANLDRDEEYKAWYKDLHGMAESNQEESIANFIIKHYTNPKTGKSLIDDEIIGDFFETHPESRDQEPEDALDNFEEYLSVNYEMPGDYMQENEDPAYKVFTDIGLGYLKGFNRPHSLTTKQLQTLGRKVVQSLYKGDLEAAKAKFVTPDTEMDEQIDEALVPALDKMGKEIYGKFVKAGAFKIKAVTSNPGRLGQYMNPVRKDSSLVAIVGDTSQLDVYTHLDNLQLVQDIIGDFDIKDSREEAGDKGVYTALPDAKKVVASNGIVQVKLKSGDKVVGEQMTDQEMADIAKYGREDKPVKAFKPGDKFSSDFDYEGMLEFGMKVRLNTPISTLKALYDSFEDVNYHSENSHLGMALDAIEAKDKSEALDHIRNFKKAIKQTLVSFNEGADPNRDIEEYVDPKSKLFRPGSTDDGEEMNERVGSLQEFIALIQDRAAENDTTEAEEAEEVMYALGEHYNLGVDILHGPFEGRGKDHDGDGDVDSDDYMAAKDKAIKKAMGKDEIVKENIKAIISKVLEEGTLNEAATQELAKMTDTYGGFEGMKSVLLQLQDVVTDIESYYDKTRGKIQKAFDAMGDIRNEEGLKVGGFLAPAIETAFIKDLRPVTRQGFTKGLDQPKVRVISQRDIDRHNSGEAPLGEAEPAKDTVYTPPVNGTLRENKK